MAVWLHDVEDDFHNHGALGCNEIEDYLNNCQVRVRCIHLLAARFVTVKPFVGYKKHPTSAHFAMQEIKVYGEGEILVYWQGWKYNRMIDLNELR